MANPLGRFGVCGVCCGFSPPPEHCSVCSEADPGPASWQVAIADSTAITADGEAINYGTYYLTAALLNPATDYLLPSCPASCGKNHAALACNGVWAETCLSAWQDVRCVKLAMWSYVDDADPENPVYGIVLRVYTMTGLTELARFRKEQATKFNCAAPITLDGESAWNNVPPSDYDEDPLHWGTATLTPLAYETQYDESGYTTDSIDADDCSFVNDAYVPFGGEDPAYECSDDPDAHWAYPVFPYDGMDRGCGGCTPNAVLLTFGGLPGDLAELNYAWVLDLTQAYPTTLWASGATYKSQAATIELTPSGVLVYYTATGTPILWFEDPWYEVFSCMDMNYSHGTGDHFEGEFGVGSTLAVVAYGTCGPQA